MFLRIYSHTHTCIYIRMCMIACLYFVNGRDSDVEKNNSQCLLRGMLCVILSGVPALCHSIFTSSCDQYGPRDTQEDTEALRAEIAGPGW